MLYTNQIHSLTDNNTEHNITTMKTKNQILADELINDFNNLVTEVIRDDMLNSSDFTFNPNDEFFEEVMKRTRDMQVYVAQLILIRNNK